MAELDTKAIAEEFWERGFILLPGFFEEQKMFELDRLIDGHFGDRPEFEHNDEFISSSQTEVVPWFPQREGVLAFDDVERDPRLIELTQAILGQSWERQYCMVMFSKAGTTGQAWHQDCPPDGEFFNLNRLVYTDDVRPERGGQVAVFPESHKLGELPAGEPHADFVGQLVLTPRRGDLLFLHGYCWHKILPVRKGHRSSTNFRAANAGAPEDLTDICVYRNMRYRFSTEEVVTTRS